MKVTGNPEENMFEEQAEDDTVRIPLHLQWEDLCTSKFSPSYQHKVANDLDVNDDEYVAVKDHAVYLEKVQNRIKSVSHKEGRFIP